MFRIRLVRALKAEPSSESSSLVAGRDFYFIQCLSPVSERLSPLPLPLLASLSGVASIGYRGHCLPGDHIIPMAHGRTVMLTYWPSLGLATGD